MGKTPLVYLRSDGFGEYKAILGKIGPIIYFFMFWIIGSISKLASCRNYILRGKKGKTHKLDRSRKYKYRRRST